MKKKTFIAIVSLTLFFIAITDSALLSQEIRLLSNEDVIVYVTKTGAKYHRAGCRYLASSCIPITLKNAVRSYTPCSVCNPPTLQIITPDPQVNQDQLWISSNPNDLKLLKNTSWNFKYYYNHKEYNNTIYFDDIRMTDDNKPALYSCIDIWSGLTIYGDFPEGNEKGFICTLSSVYSGIYRIYQFNINNNIINGTFFNIITSDQTQSYNESFTGAKIINIDPITQDQNQPVQIDQNQPAIPDLKTLTDDAKNKMGCFIQSLLCSFWKIVPPPSFQNINFFALIVILSQGKK